MRLPGQLFKNWPGSNALVYFFRCISSQAAGGFATSIRQVASGAKGWTALLTWLAGQLLSQRLNIGSLVGRNRRQRVERLAGAGNKSGLQAGCQRAGHIPAVSGG